MTDIELEELVERLGEVTVVDVRRLEEYDGTFGSACDPRQGHIPGAVNIRVEELMLCSGDELRDRLGLPDGRRGGGLLPQRLALGHGGADSPGARIRCPELLGLVARVVANRSSAREPEDPTPSDPDEGWRSGAGCRRGARRGRRAAAARTPTPSQTAAILAAFRSEQGDVAVQKVLVSTAIPATRAIGWGFTTHGSRLAQHDSVLGVAERRLEGALDARRRGAGGRRLRLRAGRGRPRPAAACRCPPASLLRARAATRAERS